jgi:hypothetical protein
MIRRTYPRTAYAQKQKAFLYTPIEFRVKQAHCYPEDNTHEFERWFYDNTQPDEITGRTYLPIFWTAYWCNNGYGLKEKSRNNVQRFVDSLPRDKKYFTICQYDDGPMVDFKDLDIVVFGMSGGRIDYPIPLLCQPHGYKFDCKRDIFASFVGGDTHPIRKQLVEQFAGKKDCMVMIKKLPLKEYCNILARSVFALAPRGYGKNSFRCQEGMQYGCIPIYISTPGDFILPYNLNFSKFGLVFEESEIKNIPSILKSLSQEQINEKQSVIPEYYSKYFTYQSCKENILKQCVI